MHVLCVSGPLGTGPLGTGPPGVGGPGAGGPGGDFGEDGLPRRVRQASLAEDFGRITVRDNLVIYLFGTPGQERFWFMWDELTSGALGAVVLADTRRLADCFPSVDFFERANA